MNRLACILASIAFAGCAVREPQAKQRGRAIAQVGIVNYTGNYIYSSLVDDSGGGDMDRWGAGSADIRCASISRVWFPGMKVSVRWNMPVGVRDVIKEEVVEIEKYNRSGEIYSNFFADDEVRVVVSRNGPRSSIFFDSTFC